MRPPVSRRKLHPDEVNYAGLLEMWKMKLAKNEQFLQFVDLPPQTAHKFQESVEVLNLYKPEHSSCKDYGDNKITDEELEVLIQSKPTAQALLLYSCCAITIVGISSALSVLNHLTLLVLDEVRISHDILLVIADKVKTLRVISLFTNLNGINDDSIEVVARENKGLEWFILPGFSPMVSPSMTSKAITSLVKHCVGLKRISMATCHFDNRTMKSMIEHLQPETFELLNVRKYGKIRTLKRDLLKQLFEKFPKLRLEESSILQGRLDILRNADVPLGFENIEIGYERPEKPAMSPSAFLKILNGKYSHVVKKISITMHHDQILKALLEEGLHNGQIKEIDFGIGANKGLPESTRLLLSKFTLLESLDLSYHLGEACSNDCDAVLNSNDIVQLLSDMKDLKKLDLSWSAITPEGVEEIVKTHPLLVDLNMEGCGGESNDCTAFLMACEGVACLKRPGLKWSSRSQHRERKVVSSGTISTISYQEQAIEELEELGMNIRDQDEKPKAKKVKKI